MRRNNASIEIQNETLDLQRFNEIFSSNEKVDVMKSFDHSKYKRNNLDEGAAKLSPIAQV